MTTFWSWYITLLTVGSLVALFWLIFATRKGEVHKNPTEQTMGHSFDGIEEYDNPLPKWWFMLFVGTLVFSVAYLLLYPGLGNFKGLLPGYEDGWTQVNQWQREMDRADELYGPIFAKYAAMPIEEVAKDERALKMGGRLFASNCSVCHATNGKGSYGFPNLTDNDWLWGGEPETIKKTIMEGRQAGMPAHNELLSTGEIRNVVGYVRSLSGLADEKKDPKQLDVAAGQDIFAARCAVCHGAEAKGNPMLGAPNLTDKIWLYGFEFAGIFPLRP